MSAKNSEVDCTTQCMSVCHGRMLVSALTRREPSDQEMAGYMTSLCSNIGFVNDDIGRLPLHMAVSCGRRELTQWLIRRCGAPVNAKDIESGYTALHRSLFYGQIHCAVSLMQLGASLCIPDYDALSPLDHVVKDRLPAVEFSYKHPCEAYVWGSNTNYTLGTGNQQARPQPEILECFRRMEISIHQVCMDKFHSVMVSACGRVFSCGHGQGGRLGLGIEGTVLKPQEVSLGTITAATSLHASQQNLGSPEVCIMAAIARDHTLLLMKSGAVLTCGMNSHHVLGHSPPPLYLLKPRPVFAKHLRQVSDGIKGICAGRFHSVIWSNKAVLTFGLHGGQLGHVESPDKTVLLPKAVTSVYHKDAEISHVAASDGATVVVYKSRHIFVLHQYQKMRLATNAKQSFDVVQIAVTGGHLNSRVDSNSLGEKGETLKVIALSSVGTVYLWEEKQPHLTRCILALNRALFIRHLAISRSVILFVTEDGEAFSGELKPRKKYDEGRVIRHQQARASESKDQGVPLREFLDPNECETVRLERLSHVHRGVSISCDPKGRNFVAIQTHPSAFLVDMPLIPPRALMQHLSELLQETHEGDVLHDVVFKVGPRLFPAHQFIVGSNSDILLKKIRNVREVQGKEETLTIDLEDVHPSIFEHLLKFMYSGKSSLTLPGQCDVLIGDNFKSNNPDEVIAPAVETIKKQKSNLKRKNKDHRREKLIDEVEVLNPLSMARDAAKEFGLLNLVSQMDAVRFENGFIVWSENERKRGGTSGSLSLDVMQLPELHDVTIQTIDGKKYRAHKCVLAARCEYFHHMFSGGWIETRSSEELNLPVHSTVLDLLLDYIYKDETPALDNMSCEDLELAWRALITADQFLICPFKVRCEAALASKLTLRNAAVILEMAHTYNADQLLNCCYQYICLNLPSILEARSLEGVTPQILDGLKNYYQKEHPRMSSRIITPFSDAPSSDEIMSLAESHEIPWNPEEDMNVEGLCERNDLFKFKQAAKKKARARRFGDNIRGRQRTESLSSTNSDDFDTSTEFEPLNWNDLVEKDDSSDIILSLHNVSLNKEETLKNRNTDHWVKVIGSSKLQKSIHARLKAAAQAREEPLETVFVPLKQEVRTSLSMCPINEHVAALSSETTCLSHSAIPVPGKIVAPEVLHRHFPQLGQDDVTKLPSKPNHTFSSVMNAVGKVTSCERRVSKLSQKQRKKLTADDPVHGSPPAGGRGWALADECYSAISPPSSSSLADIMHEQIRRSKHVEPSSPINIKSPEPKIRIAVSLSPSSPWGRNQSANSPPHVLSTSPSLSGIIAEELKQRENWTKMKTKPLALTQIEDKAIDDLLSFYNARDASEERITVRRVATIHVAKPQWVTIRH